MSSGGWEQLIERLVYEYLGMISVWTWRVLRMGGGGVEGGREKRKIKTEGRQLAVFECGRYLPAFCNEADVCTRTLTQTAPGKV